MTRRHAVSACAIALALTLSGCGPSLDASYAELESEPTALAHCEPFAPYDDLDALSGALASAPSVHGIVGADIATDVRLAGGDIAFAFGDTILDRAVSPQRMVANSLLVLSPDRACLALGVGGTAFIPNRSDGVGYWPMSMVAVESGGQETLAVFAQRVRGRGLDRFTTLGPSVAKVAIDAGGQLRFAQVVDIGADEPSRARIGWGAASWRGPDGYVYVYGTSNPEGELAFGWSLHVARVLPQDVFDPDSWEYWTGRRWIRNADRAAPLIPAIGGVSQTLSVFSQGPTWYVVSKKDDFLGTDISIWTAAAPNGPFSDPVTVASRPSNLRTGLLRYAAIAHPTLFPQEGTLVVSVSQNTTDGEALAEDPTLYRPEFFRVPLPAP